MQNEILKPVLETDDLAVPRYDVVTPNGYVAFENVELRLKNEVVQEGTPYSEEAMMPPELYEKLELEKSATPGRAFLEMLNRSGGAVRRNRPPTSADAESVGKLWVVPKMTFNNLMPNALSQVASNWTTSTANLSVSGNTVTAKGNASANSIVMTANMSKSVRTGDKIYVQTLVKANNDANSIVADLMMGDAVIATATLATPASGDVLTLSAIAQPESTGTLKLRISATYNTAAVQSGKGFTLSNVTVWNMTEDMCEAQAGNEFTVAEAANYLSTFGQFQTREYEYSTYWWVLRGVTNNQYFWHRVDDYATTLRDDNTGKLFTVTLDIDYFDMVTKKINMPNTPTQYDTFTPYISVYYEGNLYLIGQRRYSASNNTNYTYHMAMLVVNAETFEVVAYHKNFYETSSYATKPYSYRGVIAQDGSAILIQCDNSSLAIVDLKYQRLHYNISNSYFQGAFVTDNYVGYAYAQKTNNASIYYKSRSSSGGTYSSQSLGISIYNSQSYFNPCGTTGDTVYFIFQDSASTLRLGSVVPGSNVQTALHTCSVGANLTLRSDYPIVLRNGITLMSYQSSPSKGFVVTNMNTQQITTVPIAGLASADVLWANHYFGTYNDTLYFVSTINGTNTILAINRSDGSVISMTPLSESYFELLANDKACNCERIFAKPFLVYGKSVLDITYGTVKYAQSKPYVSNNQLYVKTFSADSSYHFFAIGDVPVDGPYGIHTVTHLNYQPAITGAFSEPVYVIKTCNFK